MENTILIINIELPYIHSLKGRRKYINSIKDILKNKNISVLDISGEYSHEAKIACSFLSLELSSAKTKVVSIEDLLYSKFPELQIELEVE